MAWSRGVAAMCLLALAASGCAGESTADVREVDVTTGSLRVLLAGDSITVGYYATEPEQSYAALLLEAWGVDREVTTLRAEEAGARAWRIGVQVDEMAPEGVDVAVVEVGANDVGKTSVRRYAAAVETLVDRIDVGSPDVMTVCLGPWNEPRASRRYDRAVARICDGDGRRYVRISDLYDGDGMRGPVGAATSYGERDDFHPNDLSHAAIAERVLAVLASGG